MDGCGTTFAGGRLIEFFYNMKKFRDIFFGAIRIHSYPFMKTGCIALNLPVW